jgi:alpha-N-arabinofuranosidase
MAQLVNVIAPIRAEAKELWLQTIYFPLELFANNCSGVSLQPYVACDTYDAGSRKGVPYLDVSSAFDPATKTLLLNVVNRHRERSLETEIISQTGRFVDRGVAYEVNGPDPKSENNADKQNVKTITKEITNGGSDRIIYQFPPHSFTLIKIGLRE